MIKLNAKLDLKPLKINIDLNDKTPSTRVKSTVGVDVYNSTLLRINNDDIDFVEEICSEQKVPYEEYEDAREACAYELATKTVDAKGKYTTEDEKNELIEMVSNLVQKKIPNENDIDFTYDDEDCKTL